MAVITEEMRDDCLLHAMPAPGSVMHKYRVKKAQGRKGNSYLGVSKRIDNTSEFVVSDFTKQDSR